jgi:hypothetical protein
MTVENNEVNWDIILKASEVATWEAIKKLGLNHSNSDEIQNELVCFILADTPRSKRLAVYVKGDMTKEKLNKLVYSLNKDRSWLNNYYANLSVNVQQDVRCATVRLDRESAKRVVKSAFSGDVIDSEELAIIADKLLAKLNKRQRAILTDVYSKPKVSKKQVALDHDIHWRSVYKAIERAVDIAEKEWLPTWGYTSVAR